MGARVLVVDDEAEICELVRVYLEAEGFDVEMLGDGAAEKRYRGKYAAHLKRMRREYFTAGGRLAFDTVTAQAVALHFGIVPEEHRAKLARGA